MTAEFTGQGKAGIQNLPGKMIKPMDQVRSETDSPSQYLMVE